MSKYISDNLANNIISELQAVLQFHDDKPEYKQIYNNCVKILNELQSYDSYFDVYDNLYSLIAEILETTPKYCRDELNTCTKEKNRFYFNPYSEKEVDNWAVYRDEFGYKYDRDERDWYWQCRKNFERTVFELRRDPEDWHYDSNNYSYPTLLQLVKEVSDTDLDNEYFGNVVLRLIVNTLPEDNEEEYEVIRIDGSVDNDWDNEEFETKLSDDAITKSKELINKFKYDLYPKFTSLEEEPNSEEFKQIAKELINLCNDIWSIFDKEIYSKYKEEYFDKYYDVDKRAYMMSTWDDFIESCEWMCCTKLFNLFNLTAQELDEKIFNPKPKEKL